MATYTNYKPSIELGSSTERPASPGNRRGGSFYFEQDTGRLYLVSPFGQWALAGGAGAVESFDIWISANGKDTNPGTEARPIKTVEELAKRLPAQYAIHCRIHHDDTTLPALTVPVVLTLPQPTRSVFDGQNVQQPEPVRWIGTAGAPIGGDRTITGSALNGASITVDGPAFDVLVPLEAPICADLEGATLINVTTGEQRMIWGNEANVVYTDYEQFLFGNGNTVQVVRPASKVPCPFQLTFFGPPNVTFTLEDVEFEFTDGAFIVVGGAHGFLMRAEIDLQNVGSGVFVNRSTLTGGIPFGNAGPWVPEQDGVGGYVHGVLGGFGNSIFAFVDAELSNYFMCARLRRFGVEVQSHCELFVPHWREVEVVQGVQGSVVEMLAFASDNPARIDDGRLAIRSNSTADGVSNVRIRNAPGDALTLTASRWTDASPDPALIDGGGNTGYGISLHEGSSFQGSASSDITGALGDIALGDRNLIWSDRRAVQTADAITTTALSAPIGPDEVVEVRGFARAREATGAAGAGWEFSAGFKSDGAGVVTVSATTTVVMHDDAGGATGWALALAADPVTTTNFAVLVTGAAITTIDWVIDLELVRGTSGPNVYTHEDIWTGLGGPGQVADTEGNSITEVV